MPDEPRDEPSAEPYYDPYRVPTRGQQPTPQRHPWVWAHEERTRRRHSTATLVLSIIAALLAGIILGSGTVGVIWAVQSEAASSSEPAGTVEATEETLSLAEDVLPGQLDEIMEFIEDERGLAFTAEVEVQFLDDADFASAWFTAPPGYEPPTDPSDYAATYAALGLTPSPDDFHAAERGSTVDSLMGFYDPWNGELVVRGTEWTPVVEGTVVHELAHALQDQHFDLDKLLAQAGYDADLAVRSLVEGDANRVEYAYYWAQDTEWREDYDERYEDLYQESFSSAAYDPLLEMIGSTPYWLGDEALGRLLDSGNEEVDDALRNPPTSTAEIVEIRRYMRGEFHELELPEAPTPPDGADILDTGTLGVAFLELLHLDVEVEWFGSDYLTGWRGDRYVTWEEGDGVCTAVTISLAIASPEAAEEYFAPWAKRTGGTVERLADGSGMQLMACAEW